ncbi:unnamed protein product [marine sediment metagenome]|uniref:DUF1846 domain-containing protein n=1 Tax=marine sediment metagenome TaxID=412755 RepID=X1NVP9_9ZZZZ
MENRARKNLDGLDLIIEIVTGKNSPLLHAESAAILNAIKTLAKIPDEIYLLSSNVIEKITDLKKGVLGAKSIFFGYPLISVCK